MNKLYEFQMGQRLKLLREAQQLTQEQVSAQLQAFGCDITRSALAKIEVGQRHIYPDEIHLFTLIYHTTYNEIFPT